MCTESPTKVFMNNYSSKSFQTFLSETLVVEHLFKKFESLQSALLLKQNCPYRINVPTFRNNENFQLYYKRTPAVFQGSFLIFFFEKSHFAEPIQLDIERKLNVHKTFRRRH